MKALSAIVIVVKTSYYIFFILLSYKISWISSCWILFALHTFWKILKCTIAGNGTPCFFLGLYIDI